jgi:hypothetical protein
VTEHHGIATLMFCIPLWLLQVKVDVHHVYLSQRERALCLFNSNIGV